MSHRRKTLCGCSIGDTRFKPHILILGFYTVKPGVHGLFNEISKLEKLEPSMAMCAFIPSAPRQRKTGDLC